MSDAELQYEQEQAKLRQQYEGEDVHIDPPRPAAPEVNPEIYKDVEPLLFRGFVYTPAEINGVQFVFKSLNQHEFEMLSLRKAYAPLSEFYDLFLAFGVLMVDGSNILPDRDGWLPELAKMFAAFTDPVKRKIIFHLSEINRRANRAVILSEAYAMEATSRMRWAQLRGLDLMKPSVTGFAGTSTLGMNWGQLTWRAINHFEDSREQSEREWENAKFVASAMAGKGMTKVHNQDKRRREQEQQERQERKDKILRFAVLGEPFETKRGNVPIKVARTVEELTTQLERDLKGEKDWHDMIVENQERRVRDAREARLQKIRELQDIHNSKFGDSPIFGNTDTTGLTPEEVRFRVERRRQLAAQELAARQEFPELHDPKMADFLEKWDSVSAAGRLRGLPVKKGE